MTEEIRKYIVRSYCLGGGLTGLYWEKFPSFPLVLALPGRNLSSCVEAVHGRKESKKR